MPAVDVIVDRRACRDGVCGLKLAGALGPRAFVVQACKQVLDVGGQWLLEHLAEHSGEGGRFGRVVVPVERP
jgi:hypothetical protein